MHRQLRTSLNLVYGAAQGGAHSGGRDWVVEENSGAGKTGILASRSGQGAMRKEVYTDNKEKKNETKRPSGFVTRHPACLLSQYQFFFAKAQYLKQWKFLKENKSICVCVFFCFIDVTMGDGVLRFRLKFVQRASQMAALTRTVRLCWFPPILGIGQKASKKEECDQCWLVSSKNNASDCNNELFNLFRACNFTVRGRVGLAMFKYVKNYAVCDLDL